MMMRILALLLTLALAACGTLSAKAPLFATADQIEPAPIQEGVWIRIGEACPAAMLAAATYSSDCMPVEIRRTGDGAWLLTPRDDLQRDRAPNEERSRASRMILAPLADDRGQPLFLAELRPAQPEADDDMSYAIIAPRDTAPASRFSTLLAIDCDAVVNEGGPIDGLVVTYAQQSDEVKAARVKKTPQPKPYISSCVALTQEAVREAARRAWGLDAEGALDTVFTRVRP